MSAHPFISELDRTVRQVRGMDRGGRRWMGLTDTQKDFDGEMEVEKQKKEYKDLAVLAYCAHLG